ncbi:hypothetical protein OB919_08050 [Halobacteria archaeon AArc-curdl1]|uniref:Uncharacterized protein n=1 Tax=Natronosalvus hydrolyticus TaxID=2979988 RepID=A0AAP2Z732_9EURY|nr:hypothetical protein [Halobacteria archaeon AArc-curdl1]
MVNYPPPKGKYEALLTIVKVLYDEGPLSPEELAEKDSVAAFGYSPKDETTLSPSGSSQAYNELHDVLDVIAENTNQDLRLTRDSEVDDDFLPEPSGRGLAELLYDNQSPEIKRATVAAFLLRKLNSYNMSVQSGSIDNAFHTFMETLWDQRDNDTGTHRTTWSVDIMVRELSGAWNTNKARFVRDRGIDLGVAKREHTNSGGDNLLPVLSMDIFQTALYYTYQYFLKEMNDESPEFEEFFKTLQQEWYPIPRSFYDHHIMKRGPLAKDSTIDEESYPVLFYHLHQDFPDAECFTVRYFEAETAWSDEITASEFEIEAN